MDADETSRKQITRASPSAMCFSRLGFLFVDFKAFVVWHVKCRWHRSMRCCPLLQRRRESLLSAEYIDKMSWNRCKLLWLSYQFRNQFKCFFIPSNSSRSLSLSRALWRWWRWIVAFIMNFNFILRFNVQQRTYMNRTLSTAQWKTWRWWCFINQCHLFRLSFLIWLFFYRLRFLLKLSNNCNSIYDSTSSSDWVYLKLWIVLLLLWQLTVWNSILLLV